MIEQFKALMHEHFPDYDLSMNECDDQSFLDSEANAMWMMYQVCNTWRPIETAPKDGTRIILLMGNLGVQVGRWETQKYNKKPVPYWTCDIEALLGIGSMRDNQPTHWRPLPIPPLTTEGK